MQVKQYILNQWESMGFPKLLSGFYSGEKTTDKNFWLELILVGQNYWSPLKNWLLFTGFFLTDKVLLFSSKLSFTYDIS